MSESATDNETSQENLDLVNRLTLSSDNETKLESEIPQNENNEELDVIPRNLETPEVEDSNVEETSERKKCHCFYSDIGRVWERKLPMINIWGVEMCASSLTNLLEAEEDQPGTSRDIEVLLEPSRTTLDNYDSSDQCHSPKPFIVNTLEDVKSTGNNSIEYTITGWLSTEVVPKMAQLTDNGEAENVEKNVSKDSSRHEEEEHRESEIKDFENFMPHDRVSKDQLFVETCSMENIKKSNPATSPASTSSKIFSISSESLNEIATTNVTYEREYPAANDRSKLNLSEDSLHLCRHRLEEEFNRIWQTASVTNTTPEQENRLQMPGSSNTLVNYDPRRSVQTHRLDYLSAKGPSESEPFNERKTDTALLGTRYDLKQPIDPAKETNPGYSKAVLEEVDSRDNNGETKRETAMEDKRTSVAISEGLSRERRSSSNGIWMSDVQYGDEANDTSNELDYLNPHPSQSSPKKINKNKFWKSFKAFSFGTRKNFSRKENGSNDDILNNRENLENVENQSTGECESNEHGTSENNTTSEGTDMSSALESIWYKRERPAPSCSTSNKKTSVKHIDTLFLLYERRSSLKDFWKMYKWNKTDSNVSTDNNKLDEKRSDVKEDANTASNEERTI